MNGASIFVMNVMKKGLTPCVTEDGKLVDRNGLRQFVLSDGVRIQVMPILSGG